MKKILRFSVAGLILLALAAWSAFHRQAPAPVVYQTIDSREFSFPDLDEPHIATVAEVEAEEACLDGTTGSILPGRRLRGTSAKVRRHSWK